MLFLEYIGGCYEYPITTTFGLYFFKFSEFFKLQGPMINIDEDVSRLISLNEIHNNCKHLWTCKFISLHIVEKITRNAIQSGTCCIDIMRLYLD